MKFDDLNAQQRAVLAARLRAKNKGDASPAAARIPTLARSAETATALACSSTQERLWFLWKLDPTSVAYNTPARVRLRGALDVEALARSFGAVVARHEILRTTYSLVDGALVQVVHRDLGASLEVVDLRGASRASALEAAARHEEKYIARPFDLGAESPIRACVQLLGVDEAALLIVAHHIAIDGASYGPLMSDLRMLYAAEVRGTPVELLPLPVQYADYASWERERLSGTRLEALVEYWRGALRGAPALLELPTDRPRPAAQRHRGAGVDVSFSAEATTRLHALAREEGATPFMVVLAGWSALLGRYAGQEDVVVGSPLANRGHADLANVVGCFVNPVALRGDLRGDPTFRELVGRAKEVVLGAFDHQALPFERVVDALNPRRDPSYAPIYQIMLVFQSRDDEATSFAGLTTRQKSSDTEGAQLDLLLSLVDARGVIRGELAYDSDLFDRSTAERLVAHLRQLVESALSTPSSRISALPVATEPERMQVAELGRAAGKLVLDRRMQPTPIGVFGAVWEACASDVEGARVLDGLPGHVRPTSQRGRWRSGGDLELFVPAPARAGAKPRSTVAIAATFTADPSSEPLSFWGDRLGVELGVELAPFGQVFQVLLDPTSVFATNERGVNAVLVRVEDWPVGESSTLAQELAEAVKAAAASARVPFVVIACPSGGSTRATEVTEAEARLASELSGARNVTYVGSGWAAEYAVSDLFDARAEKLGAVPYTSEGFAALGTVLARVAHGLTSPPYKAVAVDADETLWKGVVGEDGVSGVVFDAPRRALQERLVALHESGVQICVVSKNEESDVREVFRARASEMPLKAEHLTALRVNWRPKSENLASLAGELSLGLDSFVFIDDNPLECAEVRAGCPEVLVIEAPKDGALLERTLAHVWAFDRLRPVTDEDRKRAEHYRTNAGREELRSATSDLASFLEKLRLEIAITEMAPADVTRVAQLTQRTNQFNTTTRRRTEAELSGGSERVLVTRVRDRFGDYGLVGAVVYEVRGARLWVDGFMLSCRALGRGVEHAILARLGELAESAGATTLELPFASTARNEPARAFVEQVAEGAREDGEWRVYTLTPSKARAALASAHASKAEAGPAETAKASPSSASSSHAARTEALTLASTTLMDARAIVAAIDVARRQSRSVSVAYVAPATASERLVAEAFEATLRLDRVGRDDDFFALGGNSLSAVQMLSRVGALFGAEVPLRAVFDAPTVAALAALVLSLAPKEPGQDVIAIVDRIRPVPTSYAQARLWFLEQLEPGPTYNVPIAVRLEGALDVPALERAIQTIVDRHETLRTTFDGVDGAPLQIIHPRVIVPLERAEATSDVEADAFVGAFVARPFDLAQGPVMRAALVRLAERTHVLAICIHHVAFDGWSVAVFARELGTLYRARGAGAPLPALPIGYADFAVWQRAWLEGGRLEEQLAYWKETLRGAPASLDLPTDRPRPAFRKYLGGTLETKIPAQTVARLRAITRSDGATLFMGLMAAFSALLGRWSGQTDVVVGTPLAGRTRPELEPLIGMFVNTLAIRARLEDEQTFRALLAQLRETTLAAFAHQDVPFERVVEALAPPRDTSRTPIFQSMFILLNGTPSSLSLDGLTVSPAGAEVAASKFDLSLTLFDGVDPTGALPGWVEYDRELFDAATIARLMDHFVRLLDEATAAPDTRVAALDLMGPSERRRVLVEWNATSRSRSGPTTVHGIFEASVERSPEAIAVECGAARLSYRDLDTRANQIARWLIAEGTATEERVAIEIERSVDMVAAMLGVMKAGAAYVPIDPDLPEARRNSMKTDAGVRITLDAPTVARAAQTSDGSRPSRGVLPTHLAYVLYTSGSTGRPKGVMVQHDNVVNLVASMVRVPGLGPEDTTLSLTTMSFDVSVAELFLPLAVGAKVIIGSREVARDPALIAQVIAAGGARSFGATPATWRMMVEAGWRPGPGMEIHCAGEALQPDLAATLLSEGATLWNLYGPTEATVYASGIQITRGDRITIGRPLDNTRLYVLDSYLEPSPIGVRGELFIAGDGVARGYLDRPDLTAERFIPDPFALVPGARMYRTGDVVRWLADGTIDYLGRIDHQVKVRGYRIELGEIEAALAAEPEVERTLVLAREDSPGDKRLVAYIVPAPGVSLSVDALKTALSRSLPSYMLPSAFVVLAAFPLTATGKVDRRALPAPDFAAAKVAYVAPRTPFERELVRIFEETVHVERVGVDDDFFSLGGHSLLATRVVALIHQRLDVSLPVRLLFEAPTVARLAVEVERVREGGDVVRMERVADRSRAPLSFNQQIWWRRQANLPDSPGFAFTVGFRVRGLLDRQAFSQSIDEVVEHHPALRTVFEIEAGQPMQRVLDRRVGALEIVELDAASSADGFEAVVSRYIPQLRLRDLGSPPVGFRLVQLGEAEHLLLLTAHRVALDPDLLDEVLRAALRSYAFRMRQLPSIARSAPFDYVDFVAWQRKYVGTAAVTARIAAARARLTGAAPATLPYDRPEPTQRTTRSHVIPIPLDHVMWSAIAELARSASSTPFVVLASLLKGFLASFTATMDVTIVAPNELARGLEPSLSSVLGCFFDFFVLRTDLSSARTLREVVRLEHAVVMQSQSEVDIPCALVTDEYLDRPLWRVALNVIASDDDAPPSSVMFGVDVQVDPIATPRHRMVDMAWAVFGASGALFLSVDRFESATANRIAAAFAAFIAKALANPDAPVLQEG